MSVCESESVRVRCIARYLAAGELTVHLNTNQRLPLPQSQLAKSVDVTSSDKSGQTTLATSRYLAAAGQRLYALRKVVTNSVVCFRGTERV